MILYSGVKTPIHEDVKVCDLLNECVDLAQSMFPDHDIKIRKIFSCPHDTILKADPVQLQEVFNNILNNSCESFDKKRGEIEISASMDEDDIFRIAFKDDGPGIRPEALKNIYVPFNSTKAGGTGLGLPVCKQIITLHGGKMNIVSSPGKGTTVIVHLPLKGGQLTVNKIPPETGL
jgi:signal transduction histidine kinase